MLATAIAAAAPSLMLKSNKAEAAVIPDSMIAETMSAVLAFVVPGNDPFSVQQGLTHPTPGGVEAGATIPLIYGLNVAAPAPPGFDTLSEALSVILISLAPYIAPGVTGPFMSPFANMSFEQKLALFAAMDGGAFGPDFVGLTAPMITFAGMMSYSEAPVFNPMTGELVATPAGWIISGYEGVSDGRKEFKGYFKNRRAAEACRSARGHHSSGRHDSDQGKRYAFRGR